MQEIYDKWNAGFTRRWHCHALLRDTVDPTDGHSARVIKLALMMKEDLSREAILFALTHDDSEIDLGDLSGWAKRDNPELKEAYESAEAQNMKRLGINHPDLNDDEAAIIRCADKMDAHLWAMHHYPDLANRQDWKQARRDIGHMIMSLMEQNVLPPNKPNWTLREFFCD